MQSYTKRIVAHAAKGIHARPGLHWDKSLGAEPFNRYTTLGVERMKSILQRVSWKNKRLFLLLILSMMSSCSYKTVPDIKIERSIITVAGIDKLNAAVVINNKVKNIKHEIVMDAKCKVDLGKGSYLKEGQIRAQVTLGESVQQINKDYFMN